MKNVADKIGTLRASIAGLKADLKILEDAVKFNGVQTMDGELYCVKVSQAPRTSVQYKAIVDSYDIPQRTIDRFTTTTIVTKLTCQAFAKTAKAA